MVPVAGTKFSTQPAFRDPDNSWTEASSACVTPQNNLGDQNAFGG